MECQCPSSQATLPILGLDGAILGRDSAAVTPAVPTGTSSCRGWMSAAAAGWRCRRSRRHTGPVGNKGDAGSSKHLQEAPYVLGGSEHLYGTRSSAITGSPPAAACSVLTDVFILLRSQFCSFGFGTFPGLIPRTGTSFPAPPASSFTPGSSGRIPAPSSSPPCAAPALHSLWPWDLGLLGSPAPDPVSGGAASPGTHPLLPSCCVQLAG